MQPLQSLLCVLALAEHAVGYHSPVRSPVQLHQRHAVILAAEPPVPENIMEEDDPEKPRLITGDEADAFIAMLDASAAAGNAEVVDGDEGAEKPKRRW